LWKRPGGDKLRAVFRGWGVVLLPIPCPATLTIPPMRRFVDPAGEAWDAAIGRESWGTFVILFSRGSGGEVRTVTLGAETMLDAQQELDSLDEEQLRERLAAAQPWGS
jgi:hypothetical protein